MPDDNSTQSDAGPNVKVLTDLVRPFDGQGDVMEWISKLELIADLRGVTRLEKVIPLFLSGNAHCLYLELSPDEKKSEKAIKSALISAFGMNSYKAYEQFVRRVWHDESVDVFATDLKRLARLGGVAYDDIVKTQFVVGLPPSVSKELRTSVKLKECTMSQLVARARELLSELDVVGKPVAAPALGSGLPAPAASAAVSGSSARTLDGESESRGGRGLRCYKCGGPHMKRHCPVRPKFNCWTCGQEGHSARVCSQGNARGGAAAQVAAAPQIME